MATDRQILKSVEVGRFQTANMSDPVAAVAAANRRVYQFQLTDGGTPGTAVTEVANYVPHAGKVISAYITTPVAVATNATDYVTVTLKKRTAGGSPTTVASLDTSATGWTQFAPTALTVTAANVLLSAGDSLTVSVAKAVSGKAIAASTSFAVLNVVVEED